MKTMRTYISNILIQMKKDWRRFDRFATPPYLASLISVRNDLYAVGCHNNDDNALDDGSHRQTNCLYLYDVERKPWQELASMIHKDPQELEPLTLASVDDFIYVIGGQYSGAQFMEQFDIVEKKWEALLDPPVQGYSPYVYRDIQWADPIAYEGKLLVYSSYRVHRELTCSGRRPRGSRVSQMVTHIMCEYNPATSSWQILATEETVHDPCSVCNSR